MQTLIWPPAYQVRISRRAKRIIYSISVEKGLEIVLPWHLKTQKVAPLLEAKKTWIEKNLSNIHKAVLNRAKIVADPFPKEIQLRALGECWSVFYAESVSPRLAVLDYAKVIQIYADRNADQTHPLLKQWLKLRAKERLIPWLRHLSQKTNLAFNRGAVRAQKTLWGSCSVKQNINLNYKLLFLPKALVQHVLLHELCHTKHFNHSKDFWNLLRQFDPEYKKHNTAIKNFAPYVPGWSV